MKLYGNNVEISYEAKSTHIKLKILFFCFCSYKKMCEEGHETKDFSCVFRHFYNGKDEV